MADGYPRYQVIRLDDQLNLESFKFSNCACSLPSLTPRDVELDPQPRDCFHPFIVASFGLVGKPRQMNHAVYPNNQTLSAQVLGMPASAVRIKEPATKSTTIGPGVSGLGQFGSGPRGRLTGSVRPRLLPNRTCCLTQIASALLETRFSRHRM